jgi:hypothetical protein
LFSRRCYLYLSPAPEEYELIVWYGIGLGLVLPRPTSHPHYSPLSRLHSLLTNSLPFLLTSNRMHSLYQPLTDSVLVVGCSLVLRSLSSSRAEYRVVSEVCLFHFFSRFLRNMSSLLYLSRSAPFPYCSLSLRLNLLEMPSTDSAPSLSSSPLSRFTSSLF